MKADLAKELPPHGSRKRYQLRRAPCRCRPCRLANNTYNRDRRRAIVHAAIDQQIRKAS